MSFFQWGVCCSVLLYICQKSDLFICSNIMPVYLYICPSVCLSIFLSVYLAALFLSFPNVFLSLASFIGFRSLAFFIVFFLKFVAFFSFSLYFFHFIFFSSLALYFLVSYFFLFFILFFHLSSATLVSFCCKGNLITFELVMTTNSKEN